RSFWAVYRAGSESSRSAVAGSLRAPVPSTCARKPKCPARFGPTHRHQQLSHALLLPGQVQCSYTLFSAERLSLSARERVPRPFTSGRGRTMLLRHATPIRNLPSIQRHGLLCSKSQGWLKAVWLATKEKSSWAAMHVAWRHGARIEAAITLEVDVP